MRRWLTVWAAMVLLPNAAAAQIIDTGIVRLRVDLDSINVSLDGSPPRTVDSYGNTLGASTWFLLRVSVGLHLLSLNRNGLGTIERAVIVGRGEATTLDVTFTLADGEAGPPEYARTTDTTAPGRIIVTSDPPRVTLRLQGQGHELTTPAELVLRPGTCALEVSQDGYERLIHEHTLSPGTRVGMEFVLKAAQPEPVSAMELGLTYQLITPLEDEVAADRIRERFTG